MLIQALSLCTIRYMNKYVCRLSWDNSRCRTKENKSGSVTDAGETSAFGEKRKGPVSFSFVSSSSSSFGPRRWSSQWIKRMRTCPWWRVRERWHSRQGAFGRGRHYGRQGGRGEAPSPGKGSINGEEESRDGGWSRERESLRSWLDNAGTKRTTPTYYVANNKAKVEKWYPAHGIVPRQRK